MTWDQYQSRNPYYYGQKAEAEREGDRTMKDVTITVELTVDSSMSDLDIQTVVEAVLRSQPHGELFEWFMTDVTSIVDHSRIPDGWRRLEDTH